MTKKTVVIIIGSLLLCTTFFILAFKNPTAIRYQFARPEVRLEIQVKEDLDHLGNERSLPEEFHQISEIRLHPQTERDKCFSPYISEAFLPRPGGANRLDIEIHSSEAPSQPGTFNVTLQYQLKTKGNSKPLWSLTRTLPLQPSLIPAISKGCLEIRD